ncbi:MAG: hypothetical protein IRZ10_04705 [Thermoflavifilum sp.]|nr:hypothetical protein [Thermoflavifilum sp.]MCL6513699.1 hypothetical protein [Alicyclobacillus sp.]
MDGSEPRKVIIVEGKTDRDRLLKVLAEPVRILCTQGTLRYDTLEDWAAELQDDDVYILVDADDSGNRLRAALRRELPRARHLYTRRMYREVATTPLDVLAKVLWDAHFEVDEHWLLPVRDEGDPRP